MLLLLLLFDTGMLYCWIYNAMLDSLQYSTAVCSMSTMRSYVGNGGYCTVLYCTVLYCTMLLIEYCTVLHYTVPYIACIRCCITAYPILDFIMYCTVLYCILRTV